MGSDHFTKTKNLNSITYKVIGICYEIHNKLGSSYKEIYYQRAFENELKGFGIKYEREKEFYLRYKDKIIGKQYCDFVIEDSLVIEFKAVPFMKKSYQNQLLSYLNSLQIKLGLLINFRSNSVQVKRVLLPDKYIK